MNTTLSTVSLFYQGAYKHQIAYKLQILVFRRKQIFINERQYLSCLEHIFIWIIIMDLNENDLTIFPSDDEDSILDTYGYGLISSDEAKDEINFKIINEGEIIVTNNPTEKYNENSNNGYDSEEYYDSDKDPEYNPLGNVINDSMLPSDDNLANILPLTGNSIHKKKHKPTAIKKDLVRKRLKHTTDWIDVKSKCQLNKGEEHLNRKGQNKDAKTIGPSCSEKCRMKCFDKLSNADRKTIFELYWEIDDYDRKREFLARYVRIVQKKQSIVSPSQSRRNVSRKYFIPVNNEEIQVCQKMFLQTFAISDKVVTIKDTVKGYIIQHIESFPVVDSHYIRSESTRKYLENGLSISKMHRLYLEWIKEKPFTSTQDDYDNIINVTLRHVEEKSRIQISYDKNLSNKTIARLNKNADKERALNDAKYCVAMFDLQKVLTSPRSEVSSFYYKRKYATYNFTIFDIGKKQGYCYMWTKSESNRGSNEIGTCLLKFIALLKDRGVEDVTFYFDNGHGQNRNRYIYSMLIPYPIQQQNDMVKYSTGVQDTTTK
ncbi:hypothetical protein QTP88_002566 [Uroleucon formosanum]